MSEHMQRTSVWIGDTEDNMEEVVRHYSEMIYRIALTKTKSSFDADDIFQEVFLKLLSCQKNFESEEHRKAWLIRVTINCCNSHFVAPWRKHSVSMDEIAELADGMDDEEINIYSEVLKLPQNLRDVIMMFYFDDLSIREISNILGLTEANVKKRLSRARQKLKIELLGEEEFAK